MKTCHLKPAEVQKSWVLFDAEGQTLGRLCSEIARVLRGKNKATFSPQIDSGDHIVVINSEKVRLTGDKWNSKKYYRYSGYVGGMRETKASVMVKTHPDRLISLGVWGMLPKNKQSRKQMTYLNVYAGTEHPHAAQNPKPHTGRTLGEK